MSQLNCIARNINCLKSDDRIVRKKALLDIKDEIDNGMSQELFSHLLRPLLGVMGDPSESVRELCLRLLTDHAQLISSQQWALQETIPVIDHHLPQENSEEIRLQIANLLHSFIPHSQINILVLLIGDPFPAIRHVACRSLMSLAAESPEVIHEHGRAILFALIPSLTHNHSKLRRLVVSTIGSIALHAKGDLVKDVFPHLAQRFFDPNHSVREAVTRVVGSWLLDLPDRYSYFAQLIPLMLTSLSDPQSEVCRICQSLWDSVGIQYIKENEEDLKDRMNYVLQPDDIGVKYQTPNLGCCVLVQRNIGRILPPLLADLSDWLSSTRIKASELLPHLLMHAQDQITQHVELLMNVIIKMGGDDQEIVKTKAREASFILGCYVNPELWLNITLSHLSKNSSSPLLLQSTLAAISGIIKGSSPNGFEPFAARLLDAFTVNEVSQTEQTSTHVFVLDCLRALVTLLGDRINLFHVVKHSLYVFAMTLDEQVLIEVEEFWWEVAKLEGVASPVKLIEKYSSDLLLSLDNAQWTEQGSQGRFFEAILTESCSFDTWQLGLPYFERNLSPDNDPAVRLRLLSMISRLFPRIVETVDLSPTDVARIVESLIMPNIVWKAGRSASAVRTAALAFLSTLLNLTPVFHAIYGTFQDHFYELVKLITSCLDDNSSNSRLFSVRISLKLIVLFGKFPFIREARKLGSPQDMRDAAEECLDKLFKFYDNLLTRLDDSENRIRTEVIEASYCFFESLVLFELGDSHECQLEIIFRTLLLHMDDPDPFIQNAVCDLLINACPVNGRLLKAELEKVADRHRVTRYCDSLAEYLLDY